MQYQKSKKVFTYILLFLVIGTINNKHLNNINFLRIHKITITGMDEENNFELRNKLDFLKISNLFFLDKVKINNIVNSNDLVEKYTIFKKYPSSLQVKIYETNFLAYVKKNDDIFFLGSNGKLIKTKDMSKNIPNIFGNFDNKNFFRLKKIIEEIDFKYNDIKNIFFFKSGRLNIETHSGLLIKLPKDKIKKSLELVIKILNNDDFKEVKEIDLRQSNQVIING